MSLVCSLSGSPLSDPVISTKTGHLYERSTISKYIKAKGVCPHTGTPMAQSDLLAIKQKDIQIPYNYTDHVKLIGKLQVQYDALILEGHYLKNQLTDTRKQLATSLYRQDAATRVIAKLKASIDEKKQEISRKMANQIGNS